MRNVPLYVHFNSCTIKISKQNKALNFQSLLRPISREIIGSEILFEYVFDKFNKEGFNTSLSYFCSNKEHITIFNPCKVESTISIRDDDPDRYLDFVKSIAGWLFTLTQSSNELFPPRIDFCNSRKTEDEIRRDTGSICILLLN